MSIRHLCHLLGATKVSRHVPGLRQKANIYLGWGRKRKSESMRALAARMDRPFVVLEDGFIRSGKLGVAGAQPYSLIADPVGIYYDATQPSLLESWLNGETDIDLESDGILARAHSIRQRILSAHITKYNHVPEIRLATSDRPRVLVVDQTAGDASIQYGLADARSFQAMLEAALEEHPDAEVLLKTHPDVSSGYKSGHFSKLPNDRRITLITDHCTPQSLIRSVDHVYVVTSQLGFEALLAEKPVTCFGAPFYSNWGLTDDRIKLDRRRRTRSLDQLVAAALIHYPLYIDPETGAPCEAEDLISHFELQRDWYRRTTGHYHCFAITPWKRKIVRRFLQSPEATVTFSRPAQNDLTNAGPGDHFMTWGFRQSERVAAIARQFGQQAGRIEDGFIRSVGLGTDYNQPLSLIFDQRGIYFDASQASDLEQLLQNADFSAHELERAKQLRKQIIRNKISKYNLARSTPVHLQPGDHRAVILVPGQVPSDASIQRGTQDIRTNLQLLQTVRQQNPDAFIIFKPHPDVTSGNRNEVSTGASLEGACDRLVKDDSIDEILEISDEIHTMTSLVGFEGLLRAKKVVTYGYPFYAGWGLTIDHLRSGRRTRSLTLDELVAGVLIRYPRYISPRTGEYATPETVIAHITRQMESQPKKKPGGILAKTRNLLLALR